MKFRANFIWLLLFTSQAFAQVGTQLTTIRQVQSYNQYGGGDVILQVANPVTQCPNGYWLRKSDPGFGANFAMILMAMQSKTTVKINALADQSWAGSGGTFCKLDSVELSS